jgi:hypothetical protein
LANALLVMISILTTYAVAELVFFSLALPLMSLNLLPHIPDRAAFFLQSSKTEYIPRDYIALSLEPKFHLRKHRSHATVARPPCYCLDQASAKRVPR